MKTRRSRTTRRIGVCLDVGHERRAAFGAAVRQVLK